MIRTIVFVGIFVVIMYLLTPVTSEVRGLSVIVALVFAGLWLLTDVLAHGLWRRIERRRSGSQDHAPDMGRRQFMVRMVVPTTAMAMGGVGFVGSTGDFSVRREEVRLRGLPQELDGFRIGLITDPHVGNWVAPERVARAVDILNEARVHLQCMGGDLIDDLSLIEPTFTALERCRAPYGTLAVLGNHEKMGHQLTPILDAYEQRKAQGRIRLLVDSHLRIEHRGAALWIAGVDYPMHPGGSHRLPPDEHRAFIRASTDKAFHGISAGEPVLCLTHHPDFFRVAADRGAWLTLAGHTHGGQYALFGHPLHRSFEFMRGRYRLGAAHLYVSVGLGDWLPCRIGVPTEVAILTLTRSA